MERKPKSVLNKPMPKMVSLSETTRFNRTSSGIAGVLDNLRGKLSILEQEIKADQIGKRDYEEQLTKLETRRADIIRRLESNKLYADTFDRDIGPFEKNYHNMTDEMQVLYNTAKDEHQKGLSVLNEFGYHPAYKRYSDKFTAVPFKPQ